MDTRVEPEGMSMPFSAPCPRSGETVQIVVLGTAAGCLLGDTGLRERRTQVRYMQPTPIIVQMQVKDTASGTTTVTTSVVVELEEDIAASVDIEKHNVMHYETERYNYTLYLDF